MATAFVRVSASDEVSPSDVVTEGLPEAREQDEHFDASPEEAGEIPEATSPVVRTVSVTREEKDFILSNQVGGGWVGPAVEADLPTELRIDWVKVYSAR